MATLDWDAIEEEAKNNSFKNYAPNGEHTVKLKEVKKNENGNGWFDFIFEEDDEYKYPKLSFAFFNDEKIKFRAHYYKEVMKVLGDSEDAARKAVDVCEGREERDKVFSAYVETFNKLAKKNPKIKIEVRDQYDKDGEPVCSDSGTVYGESVFSKDSGLQFKSHGQAKNESDGKVVSPDSIKDDEIPTDIPEEEVDLSEIPF